MRCLTIGTFDLLHAGHRYLFRECAQLAGADGEVIVGVNTDAFVATYKDQPDQDETERLMRVAGDDHVGTAVFNDGPGLELIEATRPDLLVVGSDWLDRDYLGQIGCTHDQLRDAGCRGILFLGRLPGISSTALKQATVTAVVVTHANPVGAHRTLELLLAQTRPLDEIILVATETSDADLQALSDRSDRVSCATVDAVGDWGHAKRERGLELATGDWVCFVNDDDTYAADYLEKMLLATSDDVDVVYCEWNENPGCAFAIFQSTAGNFIVRRGLAQWVGWTGREYEADGHFIEALKAAGASTAKVDELLYWHNETEIPAAAE